MQRAYAGRAGTILAAVAAIAAIALSGCGNGADDAVDAAKPRALVITAVEASPRRVRYTVDRPRIDAGITRITFVNAGNAPHKAQLVRVDDGHTVTEALAARDPQPNWIVAQGGVGSTNPTDTASVVQFLGPGRYYVQGGDGEGAAVATFDVAGAAGASRGLPPATGSITLDEYGFEVSGLRVGRNVVLLRNVGAQPHEVFIAQLRSGETVADIRRSFGGRADATPIPILRGQESALVEGQEQLFEIVLGPGRYALLCFAFDREGGRPHATRGMIDVVTVD